MECRAYRRGAGSSLESIRCNLEPIRRSLESIRRSLKSIRAQPQVDPALSGVDPAPAQDEAASGSFATFWLTTCEEPPGAMVTP